MLYSYGAWMPLRILDEIQFWKQQEREHTVVIRELTEDLESEYVTVLQQYEKEFGDFEVRVNRYIESAIRYGAALPSGIQSRILKLTQASVAQSEEFLRFLDGLLQKSQAIASQPTAVVVLRHIQRESEYFIGVVQGIHHTSG